jgi:mannose-6-phosphate isomerase-like protein (cupin superfamily)
LDGLDTPTLVRYDPSNVILWGDETTNYVSDWFWARGEKLFPFLFALRPGEYFKHSESEIDRDYRTIWNQERVCYILKGTFTTHNPETGEVFQVEEGEGLYFGPYTWWYGYNFTESEVKVIELIYGDLSSGGLPKRKLKVKNGRYDLLNKWPNAGGKTRAKDTMRTIRSTDMLHAIEGEKNPTLVSFFSGTGGLTAGTITLLPGKMKEPEVHPGEEWLVVVNGRLNLLIGEIEVPRLQRKWYQLNELDAFYIPKGTKHQYINMSDKAAKFIFATAPRYR